MCMWYSCLIQKKDILYCWSPIYIYIIWNIIIIRSTWKVLKHNIRECLLFIIHEKIHRYLFDVYMYYNPCSCFLNNITFLNVPWIQYWCEFCIMCHSTNYSCTYNNLGSGVSKFMKFDEIVKIWWVEKFDR